MEAGSKSLVWQVHASRIEERLGPVRQTWRCSEVSSRSAWARFWGSCCDWNKTHIHWTQATASQTMRVIHSMPPRSESAMPPKLELVLRRLVWLGAPKVPHPKLMELNTSVPSFLPKCYVANYAQGIYPHDTYAWASWLCGRQQGPVPCGGVLCWGCQISKTHLRDWWISYRFWPDLW